jgi:O-antigen/teichoic acid export membrane protein
VTLLCPSSKFSVLLGSSVLAQVVLIGCSMLFARLYSADSFGTLGQISGIASIATTVAGLRFDHMAFSRPESEKAQLYGAAFLILSVLSALVCLVVLPAAWLVQDGGDAYVWSAFFVVANSAYYLCSQWQIAQGRYAAYGQLRIVQAVTQLGLGTAVFAAVPTHGMLVAVIISQAASALLAMRGSQTRPANPWSAGTRACVRANVRSAAVNSTSALLQYSTPFAPVVIGSLFFAKADIGAWFLFASAIAAPGAVLRRAILSYFNGEIRSPAQLRAMLQDFAGRARVLVVPGAVALLAGLALLYFQAGAISDIVFGARWHRYAGLLLPLVMYFTLDTLLQPFSTLLGMWGRESSQIRVELLRFTLTYLTWPLLVSTAGLGFEAAIDAYLALMLSVYLINFAVVLRAGPEPRGSVAR